MKKRNKEEMITVCGGIGNDMPEIEKPEETTGGKKMKKGLTEIVFILDRSGSMSGLEDDTIGGFNSMIEKQKKEDGEALVSTVLFDGECDVIHDRVDLKEIRPLTRDDYFVRGCTALLDAVGGAVKHVSRVHKYIRGEDVPEKTIFIITTDGMENASHKFSGKDVKKMIEEKKKEGWEFLFLGANIDAAMTAREIGIDEDRAVNYHADHAGTAVNFEAMCSAVGSVRRGKKLTAAWKKPIEEDYEARK